MIKSKKGSRIEIWGYKYINNPQGRSEQDKTAIILQIEKVDGDNYIVEIIDDEKA